MGLAYKQLTKQIVSNKIFVTLLLLLTILTSLSFFFVKFSIDGNMETLNSLPSLTENQELYKVALSSNTALANMFFFSLTSLTAFVFVMFYYRFFRENRKQIGCLKSLGYKDSFLRLYFVIFTATLSVIGSLLGLVGGYFLSNILIQANTKTYEVTGVIKSVNAFSVFVGVIVATTIFCIVTFFTYYLVKGKEVGVLLAGKQTSKRISHAFKAANRVASILPIKNKFPLRIALRKPVTVFMIFVAVMAYNICMILGYSLNISSKDVFASQTIGHNYEYDSHFTGYQTEPVSTGAMPYLDCLATLFFSDREVTQTLVGIYNLNAIYKLQDGKGNQLSVPGKDSIYVNPGLVEIYGLAIGDTLTIDISDTSHSFTVAGIAENAKSANIYMNAEELAEILSIPSGAYNGLLSMDEVTGCEEIITEDQRIEKLNRNAVSNKISGIINQVIGCVVGAILIFLALLINFQDNTRDILILNMLGYRIKKIKKLLIDVYLPIVLSFFVLTLIPSILTVKEIQKSLSIATGDYMPFGTNMIAIFIVFAFLNIIYWIVKSVSMLGVKRVIRKEEISEYT
ncbi:MAG: ABC transporter permease [Lachnospiraceae bacterium]|nr:ABC transporter permease [Lachnospiraceae bacterium]